jgi:hypothetical protein
MDAQQAVAEEIEVLLKTLQQADGPLRINQIRDQLPVGRYKLDEKQIGQILDGLIAQRRVYRFKPYISKADRFWTRSHDDYARQTILRKLDEKPLTRADLLKCTKIELGDISEIRRGELLSALVREGAVQKWPMMLGGRSNYFSTRPPDPRFYIDRAFAKLSEKLGVSRERLVEAAGGIVPESAAAQSSAERPAPEPVVENLPQLILDRMLQIKPAVATGALLSLTELRAALKGDIRDKESFDRAVIELAEQNRAALHYHDFPASLSREKLDELVTDGRGNYFIGIALRS